MASGTADSIGRTLARLSGFAHRSAPRETDTSRDNILRIVMESEAPLTVEQISTVAELHANTVRTHLEVLRAAGKVERTRENTASRGRPRWLYSRAATSDPYLELAGDLGRTLTDASDAGLAAQAARRWRTNAQARKQVAGDPDEAVETTARSLGRLGFEVEVSPVGDAIFLGRCPYAELIAENPVICDIHAHAIEQLLAGTGQPVELASLDVFPRRGVCVAHLRRSDRVPHRVVAGSDPAATTSETSKLTQSTKKKSKKSRRTV